MALSTHKIADADYAGKDIAGLDVQPELSASALQARFDALVKEVVAPKLNALIDALCGNTGGDEIGKTVTNMSATNVGGLLAELSAGKAPLASPGLTGAPTAPTPAAATSTAQLATTAFVHAVANDLVLTTGAADMTKAVYDPENKAENVFSYADTAGRSVVTASLPLSGWAASGGAYEQTLAVTGLAASGYAYICAPAEASHEGYVNSGVWMKDVSTANSAAFVCRTLPTAALSVVILGVKIS